MCGPTQRSYYSILTATATVTATAKATATRTRSTISPSSFSRERRSPCRNRHQKVGVQVRFQDRRPLPLESLLQPPCRNVRASAEGGKRESAFIGQQILVDGMHSSAGFQHPATSFQQPASSNQLPARLACCYLGHLHFLPFLPKFLRCCVSFSSIFPFSAFEMEALHLSKI
jgi:hypothetical protein